MVSQASTKNGKAMRSRVVSTVPSKHFALGLSGESSLPVALRRYGDLLSQQQILRFWMGGRFWIGIHFWKDYLVEKLALVQ